MRDADEDIKPYYLDDIKSLKRDLEKQSEVLNRLETLRNESKTLEEEIQQVRKTLISFDEFAKDATPEVLTTLIRSVVERIYVTTEKGERVMHIIIKGVFKRSMIQSLITPLSPSQHGLRRLCPKCVIQRGIANCLHSAAGLSLRYRCFEIMSEQGHEEPTGQAKITPGYNLPSQYVLHTVGPIVSGRLNERHCELLKSCYLSCLKLAEENGV